MRKLSHAQLVARCDSDCLRWALSALLTIVCMLGPWSHSFAQTSPSAQPAPANPQFNADLAKRLGADARGMRSYVMVVLKTGPNKVAPGPERNEMFAGHFANMKRLSEEGKLVLAGEDAPCAPAQLNVLAPREADLTLTEGKYHQVRRMFAGQGCEVLTLHRHRFGHLDLGGLGPGLWQELSLVEFSGQH